MDIQNSSKPILITGNYRGHAQPIRSLFYYLDIEFIQLHINKRGQLQQQQMKHLIPADAQINPLQMPYLIDQGQIMSDPIVISFYICRKYQRQDLLGNNNTDKVHMYQLFQRFASKKHLKFKIIMQMLKNIKNHPDKKTQIKMKGLQYIKTQSQYFNAILSKMKNKKKFYFGYFTIIDIFFYETTFYLTNFTNDIANLDQDFKQARDFKEHFESQQWYLQHKDALQSWKVMFPEFPQELQAVFKTIWVGDKKYL